MCGIVGALGDGPGERVEDMLARVRHRGPDGQGVAREGDAEHGHARLALVDLTSASAQPFRRAGGLLSFNGEVWNHRELRAELEAEGERFVTTGDTEVLAAALSRWGVKRALTKLRGMFAFAWSKDGRHVLARDRYGKVPLYVLRRAGRWEWASERKAWPRPASGAARPLRPGTFIDLNSGKVSTWYELPPSGAGEVLPLLRASVRERLEADAPVCVLSSGGLDSTLVLALAVER